MPRAAPPLRRPNDQEPVPTTAASSPPARLYKRYCAFCHGVAAKGDGPLAPKDSHPPDLTDAMWVHGSTDTFTVIANGAGADTKMIAFKGKVPDQDMWHIINFLRSLGPKGAVR